jgi:hypothetical protein
MLLSEAWGKMISEKNQKQKSCDTVPLTHTLVYLAVTFLFSIVYFVYK